MNYEKLYKCALERARELQENSNGMILKKWLWGVFPELKEPEDKDKRISKEISRFLKQNNGWNNEWISWLEKQKGPKDKGEISTSVNVQKKKATGVLGEMIANINPESLQKTKERMIAEVEQQIKGCIGMILTDVNERRFEDFGVTLKECLEWLEKQGQEPKKVSIWKHWKDGICGNGEGKPIFLIKNGDFYSISSCLGFECDYIELSELDNLMLEKQGEQKPIDYNEELKKCRENPLYFFDKYVKLENKQPGWSEENEQSKNWILEYLYDGLRRTDEQFKDEFKAAIAWLKKQGKKQSIWTDNDRTMAFTLMRDVDQMTYISNEGKNERLEWLNSLEDKFNNVE